MKNNKLNLHMKLLPEAPLTMLNSMRGLRPMLEAKDIASLPRISVIVMLTYDVTAI